MLKAGGTEPSGQRRSTSGWRSGTKTREDSSETQSLSERLKALSLGAEKVDRKAVREVLLRTMILELATMAQSPEADRKEYRELLKMVATATGMQRDKDEGQSRLHESELVKIREALAEERKRDPVMEDDDVQIGT